MEIKEIIASQFAEDDLNEIADYYFSLSPDYVEKIILEFEKTSSADLAFPDFTSISEN